MSAVYSNRLRIGMGLQCDPTVIYALQRAGRYNGNLRREDLQFDSPYNTYRYTGLPPGPIAAPGKGSLEAAVAPADVDVRLLRQPQRRLARLRGHARRAQPQRAAWQVQYFRDSAAQAAEIEAVGASPIAQL